MLSIFKRKDFFSPEERARIIDAIRVAEMQTSGEIRLFVESRCRYVNPVDRATEIFWGLKMDHTGERNGVLIYVAVKDHQLAILGDEGIHQRVGSRFWENEVINMLKHFQNKEFVAGIMAVVEDIGEALRTHFPYVSSTDKNELPDDIVFGK